MADNLKTEGVEYKWTEPETPTRRWQGDIPPTAVAPSAGEGMEYQWKEPVTPSKDVMKAVGSQLKYVPGDIPAIVGETGRLIDVAKSKLAKYGIGYPAEYFGFKPEGFAEQVEKEVAPPPNAPVNYILGLPFPTVAGMEKITRKVTPPSWEYEPETTQGKIAGTTARVGAGLALTEGLGALTQAPKIIEEAPTVAKGLQEVLGTTGKEAAAGATKGAVAGAASEIAGQAAEQTGLDYLDPYARFLGGMIGMVGGSAVVRSARYLMPNEEAQAQLVKALGDDFASGRSKISPDQIQEMIDKGYKPTFWDVAGPKSEALLEKYGFKTDESKVKLKDFNNALNARSEALNGNLASYVEDNVMGTKLDAPARQARINAENQREVDKVYNIARSSPDAQAVFSPAIRELTGVDSFKKAMAEADSIASDPKSGIFKGDYRAPNLSYWDQVKRSLGDDIASALSSGKKDEARRLTSLKNRLVDELDKIVPEYAGARATAAEAFGSSNAIEAGYNSIKNMNAFKAADYLDLQKKLNPEQKALMAEGAASAVKEYIENQGVDKFVKTMDTKPSISNRVRMVLGDEKFDAILDKARMENMLAKVGEVAAKEPTTGYGMWGAVGGLGTAILEGLPQSAISGNFSLPQLLTAAGGAGATMAARGAISLAEKRVADRVVKLMTTPSEENMAKLSKMAQDDYAVRSFMNKIGDFAVQSAILNQRVNPTYASEREGRASGGRATSKAAEQLLRDLKRRKVMMANKTEQMLSLPDDAVVQALDAAKRQISDAGNEELEEAALPSHPFRFAH